MKIAPPPSLWTSVVVKSKPAVSKLSIRTSVPSATFLINDVDSLILIVAFGLSK